MHKTGGTSANEQSLCVRLALPLHKTGGTDQPPDVTRHPQTLQHMHKDPPKDNHRDEVKNRIIEVASEAFRSHGIKSVKMDDIAHQLTMSKRTLYQIFADKQELLMACLIQRENDRQKTHKERLKLTDNVLEYLLETFAEDMSEIDRTNPQLFKDIMKYPRLVNYLSRRDKEREGDAVSFLQRGVEQGYFRKDINFHIVYSHLTAGMHAAGREESLGTYPLRELFFNTVIPYIRGLATLKGIEMIDRFSENYRK